MFFQSIVARAALSNSFLVPFYSFFVILSFYCNFQKFIVKLTHTKCSREHKLKWDNLSGYFYFCKSNYILDKGGEVNLKMSLFLNRINRDSI